MLPFTDTRAFSRSYVPGTGTARPCSVTSVASGPWSPCCTSSRTRIEPMLQNINCASPVAASTATRTLGRSARTSWPCETFASSNRSRSLNDCDCAVMRASIRHLLWNVVVRRGAEGGSAQGSGGAVLDYGRGERGAVPDGAMKGYGARGFGTASVARWTNWTRAQVSIARGLAARPPPLNRCAACDGSRLPSAVSCGVRSAQACGPVDRSQYRRGVCAQHTATIPPAPTDRPRLGCRGGVFPGDRP